MYCALTTLGLFICVTTCVCCVSDKYNNIQPMSSEHFFIPDQLPAQAVNHRVDHAADD